MAAPLPNTTMVDLTKNDPKEKIDMTPEEMQRFKECMKDPKFMDLWSDYAKEISDPKHLKEQEEYLKQVEREAKEQGDHSFTFIFPKPNFCVKSACASERFYINICDDEKCDEPREETTGDRTASQWMVPVSLGKLRDGEHHGKPCRVVDACYHPKATYLAKQSDRFMVFLVEIAIENVNFQYVKEKKEIKSELPMEFSRVTDTPAIGHPTAQTIRIKAVKGKEGELVVEKKPKAHESAPSTLGKGDDQFKLKLKAKMGDKDAQAELARQKQAERDAAAAEEKKRQEAAMKKVEEEKKRARDFAKNLASGMGGAPKAAAAAPTPSPAKAAATPTPAAPASAGPEHTVTEVGEVTYQDCINDTERIERKLPKSLRVRFMVPDVARASELDIDIEDKAVAISSEKHGFSKTVKLPYDIDSDNATAKFEKTKRVLTITVPVVYKPSQFEVDYKREQAEKRAAFREEAARQAEEERLEREAEAKAKREEAEREAAEEKARQDADEKRRLEVEERLSRIAEDERVKQEQERREREAELERREREKLQKKLEKLEETKDSMTAMEEEQRRNAEKEHEKLMRKIKKEMEAIKLAESMAAVSKRKQDELPFTNRYIFELE